MRVIKPLAKRCLLREQQQNLCLPTEALLNNKLHKWTTLQNSTQWWSIKTIRSRVSWKTETWTANPLNRVIGCPLRVEGAAKYLQRQARKCSCGRNNSRFRMIQTMTSWVIMGVVHTQTHTEVMHSKWCLMYPIKVQKLLKGVPRKTESYQTKGLYRRIGHLCKSIWLQGSVKCIALLKNLINMGWNPNLEVQVKEWMILLGMKATLVAITTFITLMENRTDILRM